MKDVENHILNTFDWIKPKNSWVETSYFYNPEGMFPHGVYFATVKSQDGENDQASQLDRDGVWRLNIGVSTRTFRELFDVKLERPPKGGVIAGPWNFREYDELTPHPIYGWMNWIAVLNPTRETFERCKPLLLDAYKKAKENADKRMRKQLAAQE